jgi:hypothetical protein
VYKRQISYVRTILSQNETDRLWGMYTKVVI